MLYFNLIPRELLLTIISYISDETELLYLNDMMDLKNLDYFTLFQIAYPWHFPLKWGKLYTIEKYNWIRLYFDALEAKESDQTDFLNKDAEKIIIDQYKFAQNDDYDHDPFYNLINPYEPINLSIVRFLLDIGKVKMLVCFDDLRDDGSEGVRLISKSWIRNIEHKEKFYLLPLETVLYLADSADIHDYVRYNNISCKELFESMNHIIPTRSPVIFLHLTNGFKTNNCIDEVKIFLNSQNLNILDAILSKLGMKMKFQRNVLSEEDRKQKYIESIVNKIFNQ